jgi:N-acetylglucosaminyl-diphospho-decaprenol L-rhamnosyltransferase
VKGRPQTGPHQCQSSLNAPTDRRSADLAILTVAYRSQQPLEQLATDLARQSLKPNRWLVVDNAPRSAPLRISEPLKGLPLECLEGKEGAGFGEGCNQGLEALAREGWGGWVWLLNPDTTLGEPDLLERFAQLLRQCPEKALVGTAVLSAEGQLEPSGGWMDPGLAFRRRRLQPSQRAAAAAAPLALDWLSGCSLALRPAAWSTPPRFDPALPLYYEDMDLCLRLGAAGAPRLWTGSVAINHQRGAGSGGDPARRAELTTTSYWRFLQRHTPAWVRWLRGLRLLATSVAKLPLKPRQSLAVLRGLATALAEPIRPMNPRP